MSEPIMVMMTAPNADEAKRIARDLVDRRLVACGNVIPGLTSIYRWRGEVHEDPEALLVMKTRKEHFGAVEKRIRELHPYEVPEIIAVPVILGSAPYLAWIDEETA